MKRSMSTTEFTEYRNRTHGCLNLHKIMYELYDKETGVLLMNGEIIPNDEARQLVLGTHPSGNWNSSLVGAALDLFDPSIRSCLLKDISKKELENIPMPSTSTNNPDAQGRRIKAITWEVIAIDENKDIIWVKGVV